MGCELNDYLELIPVDPLYRCFFEEGGDSLDITRNASRMMQNVDRIEKGTGYDSYRNYLRVAESFLEFGLPNVIEENFSTKYLIEFLASCVQNIPLLSHRFMLNKYFKTEKMRAAMSFQNLYIGLSPFEAPSIFSLLQALEISKGIYYPKGGFSKVSSALREVAVKNGVQICHSSRVTGIDINGNAIVGVNYKQGNELFNLQSKAVITNVDAPLFESELLPSSLVDKTCLNGRPSCGVVSLSLALNTTLNPLAHHSVFLSKEYKRSWEVVENPDT
jgi:phytoene dehydrogenase-like protein